MFCTNRDVTKHDLIMLGIGSSLMLLFMIHCGHIPPETCTGTDLQFLLCGCAVLFFVWRKGKNQNPAGNPWYELTRRDYTLLGGMMAPAVIFGPPGYVRAFVSERAFLPTSFIDIGFRVLPLLMLYFAWRSQQARIAAAAKPAVPEDNLTYIDSARG